MTKSLLPTMRDKKRYIVFEVISDKSFDAGEVYSSVYRTFKELFGEIGAAKSGISLVKEKHNASLKRGVIRINNLFVDNLKMSIAMTKAVDGSPAVIHSVGASGILNKASKKYLA